MTDQTKKAHVGARWVRRVALVVVLLGVLFALLPILQWNIAKARMRKDAAQVDQIVKACKLYAMDWDGIYPAIDTGDYSPVEFIDSPSSSVFTNSTDAFNELIRRVDLGTELIFHVPSKNPVKAMPNEDGVLSAAENSYSYVVGQSDSTPARSALVMDEMISPGVVGEYHPWLKYKRVVVGYCGGQVKIERLNRDEPGAEVVGKPANDIEDIYSRASDDEEIGTGLFYAADSENWVHPE